MKFPNTVTIGPAKTGISFLQTFLAFNSFSKVIISCSFIDMYSES
jgi:hypothetical protein